MVFGGPALKCVWGVWGGGGCCLPWAVSVAPGEFRVCGIAYEWMYHMGRARGDGKD